MPAKTVQEPCPVCIHGRRVVEVYSTYNRGAGKRAGSYVSDRRLVPCATCEGKGYKEVKQKAYCPQCNGHGTLACSFCGGKGLTPPPPTKGSPSNTGARAPG